LSTLGDVIHALSARTGSVRYVRYRDSKLTFLLKDSLGGNSRTTLIATLNPCSSFESASTFKFAQRAKAIKNKLVRNEDMNADVATLRAELNRLNLQLKQMKTANLPMQQLMSLSPMECFLKPNEDVMQQHMATCKSFKEELSREEHLSWVVEYLDNRLQQNEVALQEKQVRIDLLEQQRKEQLNQSQALRLCINFVRDKNRCVDVVQTLCMKINEAFAAEKNPFCAELFAELHALQQHCSSCCCSISDDSHDSGLNKRLHEMNMDLTREKQYTDSVNMKLRELQALYAGLKESNMELQTKYMDMQKNVLDLQNGLSQRDQTIEEQRAFLDSARSQVQNSVESAEHTTRMLEMKTRELEQLSEKHKDLTSSHNELLVNSTKSEVNETVVRQLQEELRKRDEVEAELYGNVNQMEQNNKKLISEKITCLKYNEKLKQQQIELEHQIQQSNQDNMQLNSRVETAERDLAKVQEELSEKNDLHSSRVADLESQIDTLKEHELQRTAEVATLQSMNSTRTMECDFMTTKADVAKEETLVNQTKMKQLEKTVRRMTRRLTATDCFGIMTVPRLSAGTFAIPNPVEPQASRRQTTIFSQSMSTTIPASPERDSFNKHRKRNDGSPVACDGGGDAFLAMNNDEDVVTPSSGCGAKIGSCTEDDLLQQQRQLLHTTCNTIVDGFESLEAADMAADQEAGLAFYSPHSSGSADEATGFVGPKTDEWKLRYEAKETEFAQYKQQRDTDAQMQDAVVSKNKDVLMELEQKITALQQTNTSLKEKNIELSKSKNLNQKINLYERHIKENQRLIEENSMLKEKVRKIERCYGEISSVTDQHQKQQHNIDFLINKENVSPSSSSSSSSSSLLW
jgi:hypothetical protein